jgi:phospholipid/cholesterol/gamma-HCH transport system substrate-binding protein
MQSIRVGLFFILGLALIWVVFESLGHKPIFGDKGYELVARFESLKQLKSADEIRMAGVKIGNVSATRLGDGAVEAVLTIDSGIQVPVDSIGQIAAAGLLGNSFLSLNLGTNSLGYYQPGDTLQTIESIDLNDVLTKIGEFSEKMDGMMENLGGALSGLSGGEEGEGIFANLNSLVEENRENLASTVANLKSVSEKIDSGEGTIGRLLNDPALYDEVLAAVADIRTASKNASRLTEDAADVFATIRQGKGAIGTLVYNDEIGKQIEVTLTNIREISDKLNQGEGTLGKLISDDSLFQDAKATLKKVDTALDGFSEQGPITAVGVGAQAIF